MTTLTIIKFFFNIGLVLLGAYAIYREKDLIKKEADIQNRENNAQLGFAKQFEEEKEKEVYQN